MKDAILDFILPVRSYNNTDCPIGLLDLENIAIAVGISFLSCPQVEIEVLEAAILDFSFLICCLRQKSKGVVTPLVSNVVKSAW